jgi:hypothetical protein
MGVLLLNLSLGLRILFSSLKLESFSASNLGRRSNFGLGPPPRFSAVELPESSFVVFFVIFSVLAGFTVK